MNCGGCAAQSRMCPLASGRIALDNGAEPVMQMTVRDRNRISGGGVTAGIDFGDFLIWNRDDIPAYELAVVVDDALFGITEVVRGADLLTSTARQILLHRALGATPPQWFHCPLVCDAEGNRLAKRSGGLEIRTLRQQGCSPDEVLALASSAGSKKAPHLDSRD